VVRDVYALFAGSRDGITPAAIGDPVEAVPAAVADLIRMVWREYAKFTPPELVEMTHREPAWAEARAGLPDDAKSSNLLSPDTMRAYFAGVARRAATPSEYPTPDPVEVWQADLKFERTGGKGIPMAEAMRRAKAARAG
jgi:hypothetical protein